MLCYKAKAYVTTGKAGRLYTLKIETKDDLVSFAKGFGIPIKKIEENLDTYRLLSSFDKLRWSLTTENDEYINWYSNNARKNYQLFINNIKSQER